MAGAPSKTVEKRSRTASPSLRGQLLHSPHRKQRLLPDTRRDVVRIKRKGIAEARLTLRDLAGTHLQRPPGGQDARTAGIECIGFIQVGVGLAVLPELNACQGPID